MEGTPIIPQPPEDDPELNAEKKKDKKKKKRAETLGAFVVVPKPKIEDGKGEKAIASDQQTAEKETIPHQSAEVGADLEPEPPLEELGTRESSFVEHQIAAERQEATGIDAAPPEEERAAIVAVNAFYDRILAGQNVEEAYAETMFELDDTEMDVEQPEHNEDIHDTEAPIELNEEIIHLNPPIRTEEKPLPPSAPPRAPRRIPFAPAATEVPRTRGAGLYYLNAMANAEPKAAYTPEYVPIRDEFILRNLPGGIVGYLIGRRRGRIKTEKKLAPIQKKLEAQVKTLEQNIIGKEQQIRRVVSGQPKEKITQIASLYKERVAEKPKTVAPEARALHAPQPVRERLGHLLVDAESHNPKPEKPRQKIVEKAPSEVPTRRVETLPRAELLRMSDSIIVEGSTLRQIYETHLIGERGLRRMVQEHLQGGDIKKALQREIVEREIDFERDPVMRDHLDHAATQRESAALHALLQEKHPEKESEEVAFYKARAKYESEQKKTAQSRQRTLDATLYGTILVLVTAIALLYFSRH